MLKLSSLIRSMPDYPFAKVGRISRDVEKRDGIPVINARIGIPDVEAPKTIKECLAKYVLQDKSTYGYPVDVHPERGINELVEAIIADYKKKYSVTLQPENIAVTGWTKEVLHNIVRMFGPGKVLIPDPVYPAYLEAVVLSNNTIERVKSSKATGWLPEFGDNMKDAAAFYFCDPNNPTGSVANVDFYNSLLEQMQKYNVCGIFDKAYKDYVFDDNTKPVSITQIPGMLDYGFEIVSYSKHFNFVGIGLGWVVSSKENINQWLKFNGHYAQGVEWYKQKIGVEALVNPAVKAEMQAYFNTLKERRTILSEGLAELGLKSAATGATPYLWVEVPKGYEDEDFVLNKIIGKAHVAFMPGSYFGDNGKGFFRTTLFLSKEQIEEALQRIKKIRDW